MLVLTFDMDWAPQFVLEPILASLHERGLKSTVFATSPLSLPDNGLLEIGIHPNLMDDSTQGADREEILNNLMSWFPGAMGVRTHRLYWYSGLMGGLKRRGLAYDNSLFLPLHPHLEPVRINGFIRIPYWWSDNLHLLHGYSLDGVDLPNLERPGLKILDFHPIHIYLNTFDLDKTKQALSSFPRLEEARPQDLEPLRNPGLGVGSFFETLLDFMVEHQSASVCLKDLLP